MKRMKKNIIRDLFLIILVVYSSNSFAQLDENENIIHQFSFGEADFKVFKNIKKNNFFITDENEKILFKKLKYFENLNGTYFQALDKKNRIVYFNSNAEKIERPKLINYVVCGSGPSYNIEILENEETYLVKKYEKIYRLNEEPIIKSLFTFTFPKQNYEKIYLINKKKKLEFSDYDIYPMLVIFEKKSSFGVIDNAETEFYDSIDINGKYLKIKRNGLWNIYNFSPKVKYKILNEFVDNLAHFELPNGKSGYLSKEGDEYYD